MQIIVQCVCIATFALVYQTPFEKIREKNVNEVNYIYVRNTAALLQFVLIV